MLTKAERYALRASPRVITVRYAGKCMNCGDTVAAGSQANYFPAQRKLAHMRCFDRAINDYAGDGLDARYEDQCRDICGL